MTSKFLRRKSVEKRKNNYVDRRRNILKFQRFLDVEISTAFRRLMCQFGYLLFILLQMNHFPGISHITRKASLVAQGGKFIPLASTMPQQKDEFLVTVCLNNFSQLWHIGENFL